MRAQYLLFVSSAVLIGGVVIGCTVNAPGGTPNSSAATPAEATAFLASTNETLRRLGIAGGQAGWVAQNFITDDTEALDARATQASSDAAARFAKEATRFDKTAVTPEER